MREVLEGLRGVVRAEADALRAAADRLDASAATAVGVLADAPGKVVVTGVGKSGIIAQKIAATLASAGRPAHYVSAAEATHGDLGMICPGEAVVMVSNSGRTAELLRIAPELRRRGCRLVGILGDPRSPLAAECEVVLDAGVAAEADPHGVMPTTSTTVALALGDALACALVQVQGLDRWGFTRNHPGGALGFDLTRSVGELMRTGAEVPVVHPDAEVLALLHALSQGRVGAVCVVDGGHFRGLVTDGDLRRALERRPDFGLRARDVMNPAPFTTVAAATIADTMGGPPQESIRLVPVVDGEGRLQGILWRGDVEAARRSER